MTRIPSREWTHDGIANRRLVLGDTIPGDDVVEIRVFGIADGLAIQFGPDKAGEIADALKARVELMRPGSAEATA